jgi:hypothetical protein
VLGIGDLNMVPSKSKKFSVVVMEALNVTWVCSKVIVKPHEEKKFDKIKMEK